MNTINTTRLMRRFFARSIVVFAALSLMFVTGARGQTGGTPCFIITTKTPEPLPPGYMEPQAPDPTAIVGGADIVPVEIRFEPVMGSMPIGIDLVFLIDNSGSMGPDYPHSDPDGERFEAVLDLIDFFEPTRNNLDRIAVFIFQGDSATQVQDWKSWSQTRGTVENYLMNIPPGGGTPMAHGMRLVNDLFMAGSNAFFKMVVLISDGEPTKDVYTDTPVDTIYELAAEARQLQILYSTIYLTTLSPPDDNALMERIAKSTDYITLYQDDSDQAAYYYLITNVAEIPVAYQGLFGSLIGRVWPRDVIIREQITNELQMDQDAEVEFTGAGFTVDQNILDYGNTGATTLEEALTHFKQTGIFEVHLNELDGEAVLSFSVKLNTNTVNPENYPDPEKICLQVDKLTTPLTDGSYVSYLQPTGGPNATRATQPLAQAIICFKKGLSVSKVHDQVVNPDLVKIQLLNLDLYPIDGVQIAEFPSGWVNVTGVSDDFGFKPWRMLLEHRILPWLTKLILNITDPPPDISPLEAMDALKAAYQRTLLPLEGLLGPYLCQFWFTDSFADVNPSVSDDILETFWRTIHQRGIYKLIQNLPALTTRTLQFRISDASHLKKDTAMPLLTLPIDAFEPVKGLAIPRSQYAFTPNLRQWITIRPNPDHTQFVERNVKADFYTKTCLSYDRLPSFYDVFTGIQTGLRPCDPWSILDSPDIEPIWQPSAISPDMPVLPPTMGVRVKVNNCGSLRAGGRLCVKSLYIPFTGKELKFSSGSPPTIEPSRIFFAEGGCTIPPVAPGAFTTCGIYYRREDFHYLDDPVEAVTDEYRRKVRKAMIINVVDISPVGSEEVLSNNQAIEIVPAKPTPPSFPIP